MMLDRHIKPIVFLLLLGLVVAVPTTETGLAPADDDNHWVTTWTSMPQEVEQSNLPPSPFVRSFVRTYHVDEN